MIKLLPYSTFKFYETEILTDLFMDAKTFLLTFSGINYIAPKMYFLFLLAQVESTFALKGLKYDQSLIWIPVDTTSHQSSSDWIHFTDQH